MRKLRTTTIGLTCTPSHNMSAEVEVVTELVISWSGGMGGSTKTVYGDIIDTKAKTIVFRDYLGIETVYTKSFIVSKSEKQLATMVNNIYAHLAYNGKDPECNDAVETSHYIVDMITDIKFDTKNYKQSKKLSCFVDKS